VSRPKKATTIETGMIPIPVLLIEVTPGGSRWVDELPPDILVEWVEKEKLTQIRKRRQPKPEPVVEVALTATIEEVLGGN